MTALVWCMAAWGSLANATPMPKEKEKEHEGKNIDSGSFGVFQNGHRVGTETFSIYQTSNGSVIHSEFKTENAPTTAVQTSVMQLTVSGDIRRYEWKELSPEQEESVVLPNDDFLTQKWRAGPEGKEHEQPYLMPLSTSILDDYFFIHREVLAWRFLGAASGQRPAMPGETARPVRNHEPARTFFGSAERGVPGPGKSNPEERAAAGTEQIGTEERRGNLATLARRSMEGHTHVRCGREYRSLSRLAGASETLAG